MGMVTLEEKAARIGFAIASRITRVSKEDIQGVIRDLAKVEVYRVEEGLYQVDLLDPETGRRALVVLLAEAPGWASSVVYMSHSITDLDAFNKLYDRFVRSGLAGNG